MGSGDWVDKVMVNKLDSASRNENPRHVDGEREHFYQRHHLDSKVYPEQTFNMTASIRETPVYDLPRSRFDMASTDGSEELEAATSDSSEPDLLWQFNLSKVTSISSGVGLKLKKSHSGLANSPDLR